MPHTWAMIFGKDLLQPKRTCVCVCVFFLSQLITSTKCIDLWNDHFIIDLWFWGNWKSIFTLQYTQIINHAKWEIVLQHGIKNQLFFCYQIELMLTNIEEIGLVSFSN
jgi:hypothetical protein